MLGYVLLNVILQMCKIKKRDLPYKNVNDFSFDSFLSAVKINLGQDYLVVLLDIDFAKIFLQNRHT